MKVRKAVVVAAGAGTRMLPITSIVPKELLPVCGKPVIEHVVKEAVEAGITEIILVLSKGKEAVADYFAPNIELRQRLLAEGELESLKELEDIWSMATITVVYQEQGKGLADALLAAENALDGQPFALLLGDSIIHTETCESFTKQLCTAFSRYGRSVAGVRKVPDCLRARYGVFVGKEFDDTMYNGTRVVEGPSANETESNLAFCARYILKSDIFAHLENVPDENSSRLQFNAAMQQLLECDGLLAELLHGEHYDICDPKGLLLANLSMMEFGCDQ